MNFKIFNYSINIFIEKTDKQKIFFDSSNCKDAKDLAQYWIEDTIKRYKKGFWTDTPFLDILKDVSFLFKKYEEEIEKLKEK